MEFRVSWPELLILCDEHNQVLDTVIGILSTFIDHSTFNGAHSVRWIFSNHPKRGPQPVFSGASLQKTDVAGDSLTSLGGSLVPSNSDTPSHGPRHSSHCAPDPLRSRILLASLKFRLVVSFDPTHHEHWRRAIRGRRNRGQPSQRCER